MCGILAFFDTDGHGIWLPAEASAAKLRRGEDGSAIIDHPVVKTESGYVSIVGPNGRYKVQVMGAAKNMAPEEKNRSEMLKLKLCELVVRMSTRGPDGIGYHGSARFGLAHTRLAIMDPEHGQQPLIRMRGYSCVANGEIYNFRELQEKLSLPPAPTNSDNEVLLQLYDKLGPDGLCQKLNGIFAFVIASEEGHVCMAARDHCGIKPLYMGRSKGSQIWFASELKAFADQGCDEVIEFPDGHYWTPEKGFVKYYDRDWDLDDYKHTESTKPDIVHRALTKAIKDQCMSDVPFGMFLSGGIDSAVLLAILKPIMDELGLPLMTFTVGMKGSPDVVAAQLLSDTFGTVHHWHEFSGEEGFAMLPKVVYHLETYEPELIRSAIPNYFLAQLAASKVKMVLTGEGADELFAGYLYFRDCPDASSLHKELRRIFHHLHNVNNQRSDRMSMAHGLEARVPFLDPDVIDAVMRVAPEEKLINPEHRNSEKYFLRKLFEGKLPEAVLWRTKAMQCEGIGMSWVHRLQAMCNSAISDSDFEESCRNYSINPPQSKEELHYRRLFEKHFSGMDKFVHVWEGGCRAAGAAWKSAAYTRKGLENPNELSNGLGDQCRT